MQYVRVHIDFEFSPVLGGEFVFVINESDDEQKNPAFLVLSKLKHIQKNIIQIWKEASSHMHVSVEDDSLVSRAVPESGMISQRAVIKEYFSTPFTCSWTLSVSKLRYQRNDYSALNF